MLTDVASPPYPAEHSQRSVSEFISALPPHAQESELVALVTPPPMDDPAGQAVHCVLPTEPLKALEPQTLQPTLVMEASPPYPAEHSQRLFIVSISAVPTHTQAEKDVASDTSLAMADPEGQGVQAALPASPL